jgi:hypothetical protein
VVDRTVITVLIVVNKMVALTTAQNVQLVARYQRVHNLLCLHHKFLTPKLLIQHFGRSLNNERTNKIVQK